jgi:hypothetical protein
MQLLKFFKMESWEYVMNEYTNSGELLGVDTAMNGSFLGYLQSLNPVQKATAIARVTKSLPPSIGSRAEFERFFRELPDDVREKLVRGDLRLADYSVRAIKHVQSKTIKCFDTSDAKVTGAMSIAQAKLPRGSVLVVSGISILAGVPSALEDEKIKAIDFKSISQYPALANAEFSLKANKKQIVPEGKPTRVFVTDNNHQINLGFWKLHNPRLIRDEEQIEFVIELGTMEGLDAKTHVHVELIGTITTP